MNNFSRTIILSFFITVFLIASIIGCYISYKNLKFTPQNTTNDVIFTGNTADEKIAVKSGNDLYEIDFYLLKKAQQLRNKYFYLIPPELRFIEKLLYLQ